MDNKIKKLYQDMQEFKPVTYSDFLLLGKVGGEIGLYNSHGFVSNNFTRTYNRFYKRLTR